MEQKSNKILLNSIKLGDLNVRNRFVMAPLTRMRAENTQGIPNEMHVKYYSERAKESGFVITECVSPSQSGNSFPRACGIWNREQVKGWKKVCDAVHAENGIIFLQMFHCGRAGLKEMLGTDPVAPSKVKNRHPARKGNDWGEYEIPKELTEEEIQQIVEQFKQGAIYAKEAGFDGLELHGANGYLIDQFLKDATNIRNDKFGGNIENRCRFPLMVLDAFIEIFGANRIGVKITPVGRFNDMFDSQPFELYKYFLKEINDRKMAFVELARAPDFRPVPNLYEIKSEEQIEDVYETFRPFFNGVLIGNCNFTIEEAEIFILKGKFDMISLGRLFIANPDLVPRYKNDWPMNVPDHKSFYTSGPEGYIDYPHY